MKIKTDGYFVITSQGRVGLAVDEKPHPNLKRHTIVIVQYGAGGPFTDELMTSLRYATKDEVIRAGHWGVGGSIGP